MGESCLRPWRPKTNIIHRKHRMKNPCRSGHGAARQMSCGGKCARKWGERNASLRKTWRMLLQDVRAQVGTAPRGAREPTSKVTTSNRAQKKATEGRAQNNKARHDRRKKEGQKQGRREEGQGRGRPHTHTQHNRQQQQTTATKQTKQSNNSNNTMIIMIARVAAAPSPGGRRAARACGPLCAGRRARRGPPTRCAAQRGGGRAPRAQALRRWRLHTAGGGESTRGRTRVGRRERPARPRGRPGGAQCGHRQ